MGEKLNCGASSMQGWRDSQQDAHNCIIDFDKDTSYFAVYDGHGGKEVALYCAEELPNYLKELEDYKNGNIEKALEDAFLRFDASLLTEEVITKLEKIRYKDYIDSKEDEKYDSSGSECEEENVDFLYKEALMPIEELVEKYRKGEIYEDKTKRTIKDASCSSKSSDSSSGDIKPESSGEVVSTSSSVNNVTNINKDSSTQEKPDCSESKENSKNTPKVDDRVDLPDSSGSIQEVCTPSNTTIAKKSTTQNGEVESTQNCETTSKSDVSSSSGTPHENGEVAIKKGKAVTKTKGVIPKSPAAQRPKRKTSPEFGQIPLDCSDDESEDEKDETFEGPGISLITVQLFKPCTDVRFSLVSQKKTEDVIKVKSSPREVHKDNATIAELKNFEATVVRQSMIFIREMIAKSRFPVGFEPAAPVRWTGVYPVASHRPCEQIAI
ncbi:hypothetical protein Trydic_g11276 [Trypoxylus dichotomus]